MNRGSLHTRGYGHIQLSVFRYRLTKKWLCGPERFPGLSRSFKGSASSNISRNIVYSVFYHLLVANNMISSLLNLRSRKMSTTLTLKKDNFQTEKCHSSVF